MIVAAIVLWEIVGENTNWSLWVSQPSAIWDQLAGWTTSGLLIEGVNATLSATLLGFVIGAVSGTICGVLLGSLPRVGLLLEPFLLAFYAIPKIALAPLFILWFGIDLMPKIMLAALLVFFLVFFSVYQGFKTIDRDLLGITRVMGAGRFELLWHVAIPYSSAWIFAGLKMGLPYALIGAVVGEFMASRSGLGHMIREASSFFNTAGVFAGLVVLMIISSVLSTVLSISEKRVLHWAGKGA